MIDITIPYKIPSTYIRGTRHTQDGIKCQDCARVKIDGEFACVVLADGAGSVANAELGAKLVCEVTRNFLYRINADLFVMDLDEIREELITDIKIHLHDKARKMNCEFESFASTLLLFATDGTHYLAGNLGDGLVGELDQQNQAVTLLYPENGNFLNESFFITDDNCMDHFRLLSGEFNQSHIYFLMTDGCCDCLYNRKTGKLADALGVFADWTRQYEQREVSKAIFNSMSRLFPQRTSDDCAIALVACDYDRD